jgi:hypothetical protein
MMNEKEQRDEKSGENWLRGVFKLIRKNALANPNLYGGRYTQKRFQEAFEEYKHDVSEVLKLMED